MKKGLFMTLLAVIASLCFTVCLVSCGEEADPNGDVTFTVTVEQSENGSVTASSPTVKTGGDVTLTISPDDGYELDTLKVNSQAVTVTGNTYTITGVRANITVTATFKTAGPVVQKVTVTFTNATPNTKEVTVGQPYGELPTVVGTPGNRFLGWFTEATGGTQVTKDTVVTATSDHALYPHFTDKMIVTFDYGLGSGREATREVAQNAAIGELPNAHAPANSIVLCWYVGGTAIDETYVVTDDVTVKASYISVEIALAEGSAASAVSGLATSVTPELDVIVTIDGEPSDVEVTLETTDSTIATVAGSVVTAVADGSVQVKAMYNGSEIGRTEFYITCRNYEGFTRITNKAEFMAITNDKAGKYVLTADIDLQGGALWDSAWEPLFGDFTGVLDGMGRKVYNGIAHPSGWNKGAFMSVRGTVRDIAFTGLSTEEKLSYDNGFFGDVCGTVENVFLDLDYRYTGVGDGANGYGVLAYALGQNGTIKNCVVNLRSGDVPLDKVGAIASNAASWQGKAENCFIITNGKSLTSNFDGLYITEGASGVAESITVNSASYPYLVQLINSNDVDITKLGASWSIKDGALYFHDNKVINATPEYVIVTQGDEEVVFEDLAEENKEQRLYNLGFIHNGEEMTAVPENVVLSSSDAEVAELIFDEDLGVFVLNSKKAGVAVLTVSIGKYSASFTLTLTQIMHIKTAEEFKTKIAANPAGTFILENDIDFEGEALAAPIANNFTGSLDGQHHAVKNFKLPSGNNTGIFNIVSPNAVIKNIAFVNVQSADTDNSGGIFGELYDGNVTIENIFIDYVVNASGSNNTAGALARNIFGATVKDILVNIRFADSFDVNTLDNFGALAGQGKSYGVKASNMRVIVNGVAASGIKIVFGGPAAEGDYFADSAKFEGYAAFLASEEKDTLTSAMGWKFENSGITFGTSKVLAVPEYTVIPEASRVTLEYAEDMDPFVLNVTVMNYLDALEAYPDTLAVTSSQEDVATVAVTDGKITVTALKDGETVITVSVGDYSAEIAVTLALPAPTDLVYTGATTLSLDYETAGKLVDIAISAKDLNTDEACDIPAAVKLTSDREDIAKFVYDPDTLKIRIQLNGNGTAVLDAQVGAGIKVTVTVTVDLIYRIATADEFRTKLAADLAGHFVLDADIDLGGGWGGKTDGTAFGDFSGILDGNGHKVSNFWLPGGWNGGGMFHNVTGTVKNIAFINAYGPGANVNCSGLFYQLLGGAVIENVYLDYEVQGAALDTNVGCGPLAYIWDAATVRNVIINLRFASGLVTSDLKYGSIAGKTAAWGTHGYNVKVLLNGATVDNMDLSFSDGASGDVLAQIKNEGSAQYGSYADLLASDCTAFTAENGWTIDGTGITFGTNKVLEITA